MFSLRIAVLLSDTFSNLVLACLLEPLRVVRDELNADISWSVFTGNEAPAVSSSGLKMASDLGEAPREGWDLAIVVGGDQFRQESSAPTLRHRLGLLRNARIIIGADTGSWLMAAAGYLAGRSATIHWQLLAEFAENFPDVQVSNNRYVRDGRFWTCGSAATALDLILLYIDERFGPAIALDVSAMFLHDTERQRDVLPGKHSLMGRGSNKLRHVLSLMSETIEAPLDLHGLASRSNLTTRTMSRLFEEEMGTSPGQYYQRLRVSRARDLAMNTDLKINEIALRCGFADSSGLRKAFKGVYGHQIRADKRKLG